MTIQPVHDAVDAEGMEGDLESWPLLDMLRWLHGTRRTVVMRVQTDESTAWLCFKSGNLFFCERGKLRGTEALLSLAGLTRGPFWVRRRAITQGLPNIATPTADVLRRFAAAIDGPSVSEAWRSAPRSALSSAVLRDPSQRLRRVT